MENLYAGAQITLRFEDSGRSFSANDYATQITALREQEVQIITHSVTGLRVPKQAVRVNEEGSLGIYRVSGAQVSWVPVQILWQEDDYYLVAQADKLDEEGNQADLSQFERASALRAGDTVIVRGEDIYDGKVVMD